METYGLFTMDKTNFYSDQLPYVVIKTKSNATINEEQWNLYENAFRGLYEEAIETGHRFSIIFRLTLSDVPTAYIRKKGKMMLSLKSETKQCLISSAIIIENTLLRKTVRALFGVVYEVIRPQEFCENMEVALTFVSQHNSHDWSEQMAKAFLCKKQNGK